MNFCQPSASQSKSTQTRPSSLGSRKTCEPLDPCCFRFSRLVVEKIFIQRSKSSTLLVARNNSLLLVALGAAARCRLCGECMAPTRGAASGERPIRCAVFRRGYEHAGGHVPE